MQPLPDSVLRPMRRSTALGLGITRAELEGWMWRHPYPDVYAFGRRAETLDRVRDAAMLVPADCAVGGWAAAFLHGAHHADGEDPDGVPVTAPVRTCFDLARLAPSVEEAVVLLDGALRDLEVTVAEVADYARERRRWRGVPRCRCALALADPQAASPGESRMRLAWLAAGLPRPDVNREVRTESGRFLAVADLVLGNVGLVGEYDGAGHREAQRHAADNAREEALENAGIVVVRCSAPDLAHRRPLQARLAAGYQRASTWQRSRSWALSAPRRPTP